MTGGARGGLPRLVTRRVICDFVLFGTSLPRTHVLENVTMTSGATRAGIVMSHWHVGPYHLLTHGPESQRNARRLRAARAGGHGRPKAAATTRAACFGAGRHDCSLLQLCFCCQTAFSESTVKASKQVSDCKYLTLSCAPGY